MGRISTRTDKTIYQIFREEAGLSREKASELMESMPPSRIEKIEYETQQPPPPMISFRWLTAINVRIYAIIIVLTFVKLETGMCRKWRFPLFPILFWKPSPA